MHRLIRSHRALLGAFIYAMLGATPVFADDTEIYFSTAAMSGGSAAGRPNIMFLMDTSGSMAEIVPSNGRTRLDNLKEALRNIISDVNNVNVGLMRMHVNGGPVLYPVKYIDQDANEAEGVASPTSAQISTRVASGNDDAMQNGVGTMDIANTTMSLVDAATSGSVSVRIGASADDAEEQNSNGAMSLTSSDLELAYDSHLQTVGMRFQGVNIPAGATITAASIDFKIKDSYSTAANVTVQGLAADSPSAFTTSAYNISSRSKTTASVAWNGIASAAVNATLSTPSLTSIVQEVVNRAGWVSGNAMGFVITGTGTNFRNPFSYDGNSSGAPLLTVNYTTGGSGAAQAGFRFQRVEVPQGVTVNSAYLEFVAKGATSAAASWTVYGENVDNSAIFSTTANNIGSRTKTATSVAIASVPSWSTADTAYQSANISAVVQQIVNRTGWCGGNAMSFVLTGTGSRVAYTYDGNPSFAPRLVINYDHSSATAGTGCLNQTLQSQIAIGNDDVEESATGSVSLNSSDLELVNDGSNQTVGLRFASINIPPGTTIQNANLIFVADEAQTVATSLTIKGEAADDSSAFSSSTSNVSARTKTAASVTWSPGSWSTIHQTQTSPDVTSIVQEVVNRAGWRSGNHMTFIITGTGHRTAETADNEAALAPVLRVQIQGRLGDSTTSALATVRSRMLDAIDGLQSMGGTPLVDQLFEAASYYRGGAVDYGKQRGTQGSGSEYTRVSHPASYAANGATVYRATGCTDANLNSIYCRTEAIQGGTPTYITPINESCQANYIVMLSDGEPTVNNSVAKVQSMIGKNCASDSYGTCGRELAYYLKNSDQKSSMTGKQTVATYTIGYNFDSSGFLPALAAQGGGKFFTADDADNLTGVFHQIVAEILSANTTFLAPAVTLNAFNRLTHRDELYYALFRPGSDVRWPGNIKRYKLQSGQIVDVNGAPAVDSVTGFFKTSAQSWWSDAVDGTEVARGGSAGALTTTRSVYTYTSASAPSNSSLNVAANLMHESNTAITKTLLGVSGETDTYRTSLLQWARGIDVLDEDGDGSVVDARTAMGDPLHSKPVLVTYGATVADPDLTLFATTNQGYLHAIATSDGHEIFSFVPKELLPNLATYYNDTGTTHPYGLDGPLTVWTGDANNNARVDAGENVYLYMGMRRGGRNYYSMYVSDRSNPRLLWAIYGGTGNFTELGETWSRPIKTKIKLNGTARDVLIFGGGYDANQESAAIPANDSVGRAIYIVDATTGERLWWAGPISSDANLVLPTLTNSIPADPRVIDINDDGYADMIWAADTRGQVFRFDLKLVNTGAASLATGGRVAQFGGITAANNRRFYYPPDIALIKIPDNVYGTEYLSVSIGSGYRGHPLNDTIYDRFYSFRDANVRSAPDSNSDGTPDYTTITELNLYDATANLVLEASTASARAVVTTAISSSNGWYISLVKTDGTTEGEKVLSESVTVSNQVMFTTYAPTASGASACQASEGRGRFYIVSVLDGSPRLNLDDTGASDIPSLTRTDRYETLLKGGIPPEPSVVFPSDGTAPITIVGTEVIDEVRFGDIVTKTYWREDTN